MRPSASDLLVSPFDPPPLALFPFLPSSLLETRILTFPLPQAYQLEKASTSTPKSSNNSRPPPLTAPPSSSFSLASPSSYASSASPATPATPWSDNTPLIHQASQEKLGTGLGFRDMATNSSLPSGKLQGRGGVSKARVVDSEEGTDEDLEDELHDFGYGSRVKRKEKKESLLGMSSFPSTASRPVLDSVHTQICSTLNHPRGWSSRSQYQFRSQQDEVRLFPENFATNSARLLPTSTFMPVSLLYNEADRRIRRRIKVLFVQVDQLQTSSTASELAQTLSHLVCLETEVGKISTVRSTSKQTRYTPRNPRPLSTIMNSKDSSTRRSRPLPADLPQRKHHRT